MRIRGAHVARVRVITTAFGMSQRSGCCHGSLRFRLARSLRLAALTGLALTPPALSMESLVSAEQELARMMAATTLSYRGTATYEQAGALTTLRLVRWVRDGRVWERLEYLDGPPGEIIREDGRWGCAEPGSPEAVADRALAVGRTAMVEHYLAGFLDDARVAGRPVVRIRLQPRDQYRYGHVLGIDRQTGVLMQALTLDQQGRLLERFQFADIAIGASTEDADLEPRSTGRRSLPGSVCDPGAAPSRAPGWRATWVPPGFVVLPARPTAGEAEMMHFTDGFSSFSVFVDADSATPPVHEARRGPTAAYLRRHQDAEGAHWICVVGEVPMPTARRIAEGVEPHRGESAPDRAAGQP